MPPPARVDLTPEDVLHVGDDATLDALGALNAGMQAAWVNRSDHLWPHEAQPHADAHRPDGTLRASSSRDPAGAHTVAVSASLRLRCDARPGVGVAQLATRPEGRFAQTAATSQFTKRASAPDPRPSIAAATEIAPAGYRLPRANMVGVQAIERQPCLCKGVSGQAAAHRCEAPGFA